MSLPDVLSEIESAMQYRSSYRGIVPNRTLSMALSIYQLATSPITSTNLQPYSMRFGVLDGHAMISGIVAFDRGEERDVALMLAPAPLGIDEATALLAHNGIMIAAYENRINGYESFALWDGIESPLPKDPEAIYQDLLVGPLELEIGTCGQGIAVAVRHLIEARTGFPLGLEPEGI